MMQDHLALDQQQYTEIQSLTRQLYHDLITLAASVQGRLSDDEKRNLANLFRAQIDLQALLAEVYLPTKDADFEPKPQPYTSFDQALQYAHDLAKTLRQKKRQQHLLEITVQQLIQAEKLAIVGQVAAAVAHELNNMLAPLPVYAKAIDEAGLENTFESGQIAYQIANISDRASIMLDHLIEAAQSESLIANPLNPADIITKVLTLLSPQLKKQNILVNQSYTDSVPLVMGSPNQLKQVLINLMLNSFEAMSSGGELTVGVSALKRLDLDETDYVAIYIADNGIGIPPESIDLIFEPFYTTKINKAGSGLGLFVTRLIIERQGGTIEVESNLGKGTTFIIKLPVINNDVDHTSE